MKRLLVVALMLIPSLSFAIEVNTVTRATADGYATTAGKSVRVISINYKADSIGCVNVYNGTTRVGTLEHVVSDFGPFAKDVAPIFTNGVYLDFIGITPAEATVVYQKLE